MPSLPSAGATATGAYVTAPTADDPYPYQTGFGNRFATEAVAGALPQACNTPQRCPYDLVSEQLNGTPFVSPRSALLNAWLYRIMPSVAHKPLRRLSPNADLEAVFSPLNPNAVFTPQDLGWDAFPLPPADAPVDFVDGLKTVAGQGDPALKDGLAVHVYLANAPMRRRAFCNNDGDLLLLPQLGRLDLQTEFGRLMVAPGELAVVQAGIKFRVGLPDGVGRGYVQEIYGSHYVLPELGPVGSNGMALPRDFETPVASFDVDVGRAPWTIVVKLAGQLFAYEQGHTPFDVVAWHGTYVPYKYNLAKFINAATVDRDQSDPSIYCVLTAPSLRPGVSAADFLVFTPKWSATRNTFRPPYYHRNVATELMGMIHGVWSGSATHLTPGGLTYEPSFMPHGESYQRWHEATTADLQPARVGEGAMAFMMHISAHVSLTKYAIERATNLQPIQPDLWDDFQPGFLRHLEAANGANGVNGDKVAKGALVNGHGLSEKI